MNTSHLVGRMSGKGTSVQPQDEHATDIVPRSQVAQCAVTERTLDFGVFVLLELLNGC